MQAGERGWRVASGGAASRWRVLATGREMQTAREMTLRRGEVTGDPRRWERAEHRHVSLRHHLAEAQAREGGVFDVAEPVSYTHLTLPTKA